MSDIIRKSPYWWDGSEGLDGPANTPLPRDVDMVVVGGGFTGLSAALCAAEAGRSVLVLDEGQPGRGASTRNGGICTGGLRISHAALSKRFGKAHGDAVYSEGVTARQDLADFISAHKIDCQYQLSGHFIGALSRKDFDRMQREIGGLSAIAGIDIALVPRDQQGAEIQTDRFFGGILRRDIAGFHPGKFFAALLRLAIEAGVQIASHTEVQMISDDRTGGKLVSTPRGSVRAGQVIVATNAYTGRKPSFGHFLRRRLVPVQSCIIVTEKIGHDAVKALMPGLRLYGNTAKLSCYFRPVPDGDRILLGARSFDRVIPSDKSVRFLRSMLAGMFPSLADVKIDYSWLGNVAFHRTYLPAVFAHDGVVYASGYGGSGTVWARWLGKKAAQLALESDNAPSVFTKFCSGKPPPAIPFYDGEPWFMPFINASYAVQDSVNSMRFRNRTDK